MLSNNTISKLHEMRLSVMAKTFREQLTDSNFQDLSFEERFGLTVDAEVGYQKDQSADKVNQKRRV